MTTLTRNGVDAKDKHSAPARSQPRSKRDHVPHLSLEGTSRDARRQAVAILEVLAGARTPSDAAQALGISLSRYYTVELRALQGLLAACAPRKIGRVRSSQSELALRQQECEQLRRECGRQQALVRAAQRTIGLASPAAPTKTEGSSKKRRKRRPTARALKAVAALQIDAPEAAPELTASVTKDQT